MVDGKTHALVGAGIGFGVGLMSGVTSISFGMVGYIGLGVIAGLIPDLDTNGLLSNRITLNKQVIKGIGGLLGIFGALILFMYYTGDPWELLYRTLEIIPWGRALAHQRLIILGAGICLLGLGIITQFMTQRSLLFMTGLGVTSVGFMGSFVWAIHLGIYIMVASYLPHRSYTHSLLGLAYFAYIAFTFSVSSQLDGVFTLLVSSYASHLICDMKILPGNKRGVKLFQPFSNIEL